MRAGNFFSHTPHDNREAVKRKLFFARSLNAKICVICVIHLRRVNSMTGVCLLIRTGLRQMWCHR